MIAACASRSSSSMPSPTNRTTSAAASRPWSVPRAMAHSSSPSRSSRSSRSTRSVPPLLAPGISPRAVPGPITDRFAHNARELGVVTILNLFERDGDCAYDCSPVIDADGSILGRTRMVHITDYPCFHEQGYYTPGDTGAPVYQTKAGTIGVAICYDRHYPEYMRALKLGGAELVVVPQAGAVDEWPDGLYEGEMRVAAFQNGYFVALCNRVGAEECLTFGGESFVCAPDGTVVARAPRLQDAILMADVDLDQVRSSHADRLFMQHRRPELYAQWFRTA